MSRNRARRSIPVFGTILLSLFMCVRCSPFPFIRHGTTTRVLPKPAHARGGMELVWGPDVKKAALSLIRNSKHIIYLDMYELSDTDILSALKAAYHRHVDVRVVLDATESHSTQVGYPTLQKAGIPVRLISIKEGIDHVKMLLTDNAVLMGGMNYGSNSWSNNDASVLMPKPNGSFQSMFLWDFARASGAASQAPSVVLPLVTDRLIQGDVLQAIQGAKHSVDMEAFDLSDRDVVSALHSAVARGVTVTILVDPTQTYSRTPVTELRDAGALVSYYRPYSGELMHAKIVDVDGGSTFIIGSANFSHQAYTYNHEADFVLHDVPTFDAALRQDLSQEMARGSDYPVREKTRSWA